MTDDDLKRLWQDQPLPLPAPSLDRVKADARATQRRVARRNALEYVACVLVLAVFSFYIAVFPSTLMRVGSALVMAGTLVVAWQLHRRASSTPLPEAVGEQGWLAYQRAQLVRQRDALRSAWLWYVAPFLPGVAVFRWGVEVDLPAGAPFVRGWVANLGIALVFLAVAVLNRWAARRLQRQIDALDTQTR